MSACLPEKDFQELEKVLDNFKNSGEAEVKQAEFLKKYDTGSRNWLEKLWVEEAYLKYRGPIYHLNYGGTGDIPDGNIPLEDPKKPFNYNHIARFMYGLSKYWQSFKTETVPPQEFRTQLGTDQWSMDCYKKWFSSAQVPGEDMDEIVYNFYTNSEEPKSDLPTDHLIFLVNGHYYTVKMCDSNQKIYGKKQFESIIEKIIESHLHETEISTPTVSTIDMLNRTEAYHCREKLNEKTRTNMKMIENAAFCITVDFESPTEYSDILQKGTAGNPRNRMLNKCYNVVFFKKGYAGMNANHTMCEGMAQIFADRELRKHGWPVEINEADNNSHEVTFEELEFELPEAILPELEAGLKKYDLEFAGNLRCRLNLVPIGKNQMRPLGLHPAAVIQVGLQLAYFMQHGEYATVYETAQLRKFYNGRTETCRTCTPEIVKFIKLISAEEKDVEACAEAFAEAHMGYLMNMVDCINFRGFDRHLMALKPCSVTDHYTYQKGGASNFHLSSSSIGSLSDEGNPHAGACMPFRLDGYGAFYGYSNTQIFLSTVDCRASPETDSILLAKNLEKALNMILNVMREA